LSKVAERQGRTVVMNIATPMQGFQRSQGQIAAQLKRALQQWQSKR